MIKGETYTVHIGNNLDILPTLEDNSIDSIVTDPPYELGFMGKKWDSSGIAYSVELWKECLRVLKPGGHLLSFGGTRTWHRVAVAIEDAGFEVRDSIAWMYGSGFPKSLDISKAIDKNNGESGRKLKFTLWFRSTSLTVKQVTNVLRSAGLITENGTMASHFFAQSYAGQPAIPTAEMWQVIRPLVSEVPDWIDELIQRTEAEREVIGQKTGTKSVDGAGHGIIPGGITEAVSLDITAPSTPEAQQWEGWGTALKPAFEPIVVARKPLIGTVAANVLEHGTGGLNIDGSRIGTTDNLNGGRYSDGKDETDSVAFGAGVNKRSKNDFEQPSGRWPANVILDPYTAELLDEQSGVSKSTPTKGHTRSGNQIGDDRTAKAAGLYGDGAWISGSVHNDSGGASRFFYVAKASKRDRNEGLEELEATTAGAMVDREDGSAGMNSPRAGAGRTSGAKNFHPTVKPTALMRYLVKLVTPSGGTVLDPFTGSGSTGKAAILEGFEFVGIELTEDYIPIIKGRLKHAEETVNNKEEGLF